MFLSMAFSGTNSNPSSTQPQHSRRLEPWSATVNWKPRDDVVRSTASLLLLVLVLVHKSSELITFIPFSLSSSSCLEKNENRRAVAILTFLDDEQLYLGCYTSIYLTIFKETNAQYAIRFNARLHRTLSSSRQRDREKGLNAITTLF